MNFQKINNITGWAVFGLSLVVYWLTLEETASYWDCGEFIAVSYKLEVPHPPGAPLFLLLGRLFSFISLGDVSKVALWVNFMSALASAFTILFSFWSITLLGRRIVKPAEGKELTDSQSLLLLGAGLIGALAYAFSDSFWFSAVEAEVYAMSSFFTSFVVWGMLKWELIEDEGKANKWLILIAYMMGLSIGIHMLNLVTIPALGLIYYFKKYKPSRWGIVASLLISVGVVAFINDFIVPGFPAIAGSFEIFFVNAVGMPFGSGVIVFCTLIVGALVFGIWYSQSRNMPMVNTLLLSVVFILIGYSSYATILIRSNFDPPINENAPSDVMTYVRYLKREQYGSRPLLFGPYFTSKVIDVEQGAAIYKKGKDRYDIIDRQFTYKYDKETFLPRAWSTSHASHYRRIMEMDKGEVPTFAQNILYMLQHQIGVMYIRYFMWNFAGRQSDLEMADWLGPSDWFKEVPSELANNKGRNNFFMIPLFLGLIGAFFQFTKDAKGFVVVGLLFLMLGVAIVVYLNAGPIEPRERDYIYTGSMYAFTFWIGFAVIAIAEMLKKYIKKMKPSIIIAFLIALSAPVLMALEGWDDHDRSDRFFSLDSGENYLASCAPNAILYTGGDNDTFMLWYAQEVENFRTDIRVVVLSYYNTDWYIEQSMQGINQSAPLPYTLSLRNYRQGGPNDYLPFHDLGIASIDVKQYLDLVHKEHPKLRNSDRNIIPSRLLTLKINKDEILAKGIIPAGMDSLVVDQMEFQLIGNGLEKKDLAFLDMLATNNWERPIYVNHTSLSQFKIDLSPYAIQEGNVSRILPIRNPKPQKEFVNTEIGYDNVMNKYKYRGLNDKSIYYSGDYKNFVVNHRSTFNTLAEALLEEDHPEKAKEVLLFSLEKITDEAVPYDQTIVNTLRLLFRLGEKEKAIEISKKVGARTIEMATYLVGRGRGLTLDLRKKIYMLGELQAILSENEESELARQYNDEYEKIVNILQASGLLR